MVGIGKTIIFQDQKKAWIVIYPIAAVKVPEPLIPCHQNRPGIGNIIIL